MELKLSFLKWMGGKSKVLHLFKDYFPDFSKIDGYIEPFIGGGSVFFYLKENGYLEGKKVYLSDINGELITTYKVVRDKLNELIPLLEKHEKLNNKEYYYEIKKSFPPGYNMTDVEKAAAFIYLSHNSFGGLWRVNSEGKMNAPYRGNEDTKLISDELYKCSKLLQDTHINCCSFDKAFQNIKNLNNWFVYMDPPYFNVDSVEGFTRYTKAWGISEKSMLRNIFYELHNRNAKVMMSNSDAQIMYDYFKDFHIETIDCIQRIYNIVTNNNAYAKMRNKPFNEVVVTNYEVTKKQRTIEDAWS